MDFTFLPHQPVHRTLPDDSLELIQFNRVVDREINSFPDIPMGTTGAVASDYRVSLLNGPPDLWGNFSVPGTQAVFQDFCAAMVLGGFDSVPSVAMERGQLSSVDIELCPPCQGFNLNSMVDLPHPPNKWHQGDDITSWALPVQPQSQSSTSPVSLGNISKGNIAVPQVSDQVKTIEDEALCVGRGHSPGNGQSGPTMGGDRFLSVGAGSMSPCSQAQDGGSTGQTPLSPPQLRLGVEDLNDCLEECQGELPTQQRVNQAEPVQKDKPTDQGNYIDLTGCDDEPLARHQSAKLGLRHLTGSPKKGISTEQVNLRAEEVIWSLEGEEMVYKWGTGNKFWINNTGAADRLGLNRVVGEVLFSERENITITLRPNLLWWPVRVRWNKQTGLYDGHGPDEEDSRLEVKPEDMFDMICGSRDAQGRTGTYIWLEEEEY
ncbi:hypothetical protein FALBO_4867 [Fusarium albosuccineum]|uniref:Uncharacterized protein n=1 Tax=Fusarium albosuccineum TaxID=1237068 RepID=A0A8H4LHJ4_9HYPO|nr:hypothetical protein FALBO_4867 [Fusarium albosuccineum]